MIKPELISLARRRIDLELRERKRAFGHTVGEVKGQFVGANMLWSSSAQQRLGEVIEQELQVRAMLAWQILSRILSNQPLEVDGRVGNQMKETVAGGLDSNCDDILSEYESVKGLLPGTGLVPPWESLRWLALEKVESEIDITLLSAAAFKRESGEPTTINIYQSYGIVQTGAGATASLVQNFGQAERQRLSEALDAVENVASESADLSPRQLLELDEVVGDIRGELAKESPNMSKVRGALIAISTTIQTLGSAAGAYDLLKGAAALIGVHLP